MNRIGTYKGVEWKQHRLGDVFPNHPAPKLVWIFEYDDNVMTGNHFRTLDEFKKHVDKVTP